MEISEKWGQWGVIQRALCEKGYLRRLTFKAVKTYNVLCTHMDLKTGICWPTIETLRKSTGLSKNAQYKSIRELEEKGLIKTWRHRKDKNQTWGKKFFQILPIKDISTTEMDIYRRTTPMDIYPRKRDARGRFKRATYHGVVKNLYHGDGPIPCTTEMDTNKTKTIYKQDQEIASFRNGKKDKEAIRELIQLKGKDWTRNYLAEKGYNPELVNEIE